MQGEMKRKGDTERVRKKGKREREKGYGEKE